jgi:hypothetical protein
MQVKALLALHQVLIALQRERGTCIWAMVSEEGVTHFQWRIQKTDVSCKTAEQLVKGLTKTVALAQQAAAWHDVQDYLTRSHSSAQDLRPRGNCIGRPDARQTQAAFKGYNLAVSVLIDALSIGLHAACGDGTASVGQIRHKLLVFASEQLGRERAYLCSLLDNPDHLHQPSAIRCLTETIGARKVLLGSTDTCNGGSAGDGNVVAGHVGLVPALGLAEESLLDSSEMAALEVAEENALACDGTSALAVLEWYDLLTKLIDNVHQHIVLNIMEILPSPSLAARTKSSESK